MDVLSRRELNRATLARQHLLERAPAGARLSTFLSPGTPCDIVVEEPG